MLFFFRKNTNLFLNYYKLFIFYALVDFIRIINKGKSTYVPCDVRKEIELNIPISSDDSIINLAAVHRTPGHPENAYFETNMRGAENVYSFAEKHKIRKIVFTSSIVPYGAAEELREEITLPTPNTPYGISKLATEKIHQIWQTKNVDNELTIVRPGVVFGKDENGNFTRLYWGIKKRRFFYPGRKDTIKACIYVKELVNFMTYKLTNHKGGMELFNCTYEPAFTIEQIIETIKDIIGLNRHIIMVNGSLLTTAASIIGYLGGKKLGIHPARVKKMVSANICGKKIVHRDTNSNNLFEEAIRDWYR
ncbi:N-acetyl-alpha-D-glucosaminyl-diphospho-ditrans octacis-undecaprenol 4-epimerase [termite gut metagenome]|uniref:N-acetyl-alpha-D-glucosaminyl-diphospho-ditrans octacis-undecaprenol 4-epimerase n=1 Tax=termite gut metagenome TaxID=433724 RepID=A0A5J4QBX1_9ZZZZ